MELGLSGMDVDPSSDVSVDMGMWMEATMDGGNDKLSGRKVLK